MYCTRAVRSVHSPATGAMPCGRRHGKWTLRLRHGHFAYTRHVAANHTTRQRNLWLCPPTFKWFTWSPFHVV